MTEKGQPGSWRFLGRLFTVSNNVDRWNDEESICDLRKNNFNGTTGIKLIHTCSRKNEKRQIIPQIELPLFSFVV